MKTTITAEELRELGACEDEFPKYLDEFGEEPAKFSEVFKHMGWGNFWWGIGEIQNNLSEFQLNDLRLLACDYADSVIHLYESKFDDDRPRKSIESSRAYARGQISKEEMAAARAAANAAAWAAASAASAADRAAGTAARAAVWAADRAADRAAASAASAADRAAGTAARAAVWAADRAAARADQERQLLDLLLAWETANEE